MTPPGERATPAIAAPEPERRPLLRRLVDAIFGLDYFISYAWSDGRPYAVALSQALREAGFECFLDSTNIPAGDRWFSTARWSLRRTKALIVVGSPGAVQSVNVLKEVKFFREFERRIVPIEFGKSLDPGNGGTPLAEELPREIIRLSEAPERERR